MKLTGLKGKARSMQPRLAAAGMAALIAATSAIPYGVQDGNSASPPPTRGDTYVPDKAGAVASMYSPHIGGHQLTNLRLSGAVIAGISTNKITMWNDPLIAADNPGLTLPAVPIVPVVRTDSSGSTLQFTRRMTATQGSSWTSAGIEPISVIVPLLGSFTVTVRTGAVKLSMSGSDATGALNPITVSDTRNNYPGWSVSGQAGDFTGSGTAAGSTISGNQLGWAPTEVTLGTGVTLGGTVTPSAPGLGTTAAFLAWAHAGSGFGTSRLGANLTLVIPAAAKPGDYTSTLTVTAVAAVP